VSILSIYSIKLEKDLLLEQIDFSHSKGLVEVCRKNKNFIGNFARNYETLDHSNNHIKNISTGVKYKEGITFVILFQKNIIGVIGTHSFSKKRKSVYLGGWLIESYTGIGIMTKSSKALEDLLFKEFDIEKINLEISVDNKKSINLARRLGYILEGISRKIIPKNDSFYDAEVYGMTREDWSNRRKWDKLLLGR
jgi:ribosomal-protein-serine acetyltransferase